MALCHALMTTPNLGSLSSLSLSRPLPLPLRTPSLASSARGTLSVRSQFLDGDKPETKTSSTEKKGSVSYSPLTDASIPDAVSRVGREASEAASSAQQALKDREGEPILGTSGTFGFTKHNELFVGRVAMLGLAASVIGELALGKGAFGQVGQYTGLDTGVSSALLVVFITTVATTGLLATGDEGYHYADPQQPLKAQNWRDVIGLAPKGRVFGWTRPNEMLNGRVAMLAFIGHLVGEVLTKGKGLIGQISVETNTPVAAVLAAAGAYVAVLLLSSVNLDENRLTDDRDIGA